MAGQRHLFATALMTAAAEIVSFQRNAMDNKKQEEIQSRHGFDAMSVNCNSNII